MTTLDDLTSVGVVDRDRRLDGLTTYKFGGPAAWYAEVTTEDALLGLLEARYAASEPPPIFLLGRGSNVVISSSGFPGLVIHLAGDLATVSFEPSGVVAAGGGASLSRVARAAAAAGRGGLEFYVGIPGTVGGAVVMNAGGHGADTADWLLTARILDVPSGEISERRGEALDLSYRHSNLTSNDIVLAARFRTVGRDPAASDRIMREISRWRRAHQPGGTFNAGSVFKNPEGDSAGRMIDQAGLKGFRRGAVAVSERHANFFVADPDARPEDVFDLVQAVQSRVEAETGVRLVPEIKFIGKFERAAESRGMTP